MTRKPTRTTTSTQSSSIGFGLEFRKRGWNVRYKIGSGAKALAAALGKADGVYITEAAYYALTSGDDLTWRRLYQD